MRRTLAILTMVLTIASCGGTPPTDSAEQTLDTYKLEVLGGCCDTSGGWRVGDPAPVLQFQAGATLPPMPHNNAEHQASSFELESAISSQHADGGHEKIELSIYRTPPNVHGYQMLVETRDGDAFATPVAKIVYAGDTVWAMWTYVTGCIRVANDNASGLGAAFNYCVPFTFVNGHYPDTVYPTSTEISVVDCPTDMPYPANGSSYGSFTTWTLYGIGTNGPWSSPGPHTPVNAGCGLAQTYNSQTQLSTVSWNVNGSI